MRALMYKMGRFWQVPRNILLVVRCCLESGWWYWVVYCAGICP